MKPDGLTAEALLNRLTSGAVVIDGASRKILHANPRFIELVARDPADLAGQPLSRYIKLDQGDNGKSKPPALPQVATGKLEVAGDHDLRVKLKTSPLDGKHVLVLVDPFSEDMALTEAHSDFVSTVSHEFRTPLTSIKGFADTMLNYGANLPPEQQRRFIGIIKDQADRLIRLVENLLSVSRLGTSRETFLFRPVNLPKTVQSVAESIAIKHAQPDAIATEAPESLPPVWADSDALEQILLNLADNALKYSKQPGGVNIKAALKPDNHEKMVITVSDKGVGISPEHLEKLFTKFYRVENHLTQNVEGTGLGLYIVKSLTTALGGEIDVKSEPGKGTTFILTLPVATGEMQVNYQKRRAGEGRGV